jgi:hypothetical protein
LTKVDGGPIKMWIVPDIHGRFPVDSYAAGADISTGSGATNSCLSLMNSIGKKVVEIAVCNMKPEQFASLCCAFLRQFKDEYGEPPLFCHEHKGPGMAFGKRMIELGYSRLFYQQGHAILTGGKKSTQPGWCPTNDSKLLLLTEYRAGLDKRRIENPSEIALKECVPYFYSPHGVEHPSETMKDDPTGARVNHGDRVIADALAWKMCEKSVRIVETEKPRVEQGSMAWRMSQHKGRSA